MQEMCANLGFTYGGLDDSGGASIFIMVEPRDMLYHLRVWLCKLEFGEILIFWNSLELGMHGPQLSGNMW